MSEIVVDRKQLNIVAQIADEVLTIFRCHDKGECPYFLSTPMIRFLDDIRVRGHWISQDAPGAIKFTPRQEKAFRAILHEVGIPHFFSPWTREDQDRLNALIAILKGYGYKEQAKRLHEIGVGWDTRGDFE